MKSFQPTHITSWGRVVRAPTRAATPNRRREIAPLLAEAKAGEGGVLAMGLRRSYGQSCLNPGGHAIDMTGLDRFIAFDRETGVVRAEAGLSLGELIKVTLPHGWFPAVTPGTRFVTLGGAIANDVHGKNHQETGTFGRHVRRMGLLRSDGVEREVSPDSEPALFAATIGGLGLTGIITWVELALRKAPSAYVCAEHIGFTSLTEYFALEEASQDYAYRVAWVDCTSRGAGVYSRAHDVADGDYCATFKGPRLSLPVDLPGFALNPLTLRAFNAAYGAAKRSSTGPKRTPMLPFFYPLDAIGNWNRLYGPQGFFQYQFVVPHEPAPSAVQACLEAIADSGEGSFLAVLKTFGDIASPGLLSFPMPGVTLALDFANRGQRTLDLFARLDAIVERAGGRLYAAKDGRIPPAMFKRQHALFDTFAAQVDPAFSSGYWKALQA